MNKVWLDHAEKMKALETVKEVHVHEDRERIDIVYHCGCELWCYTDLPEDSSGTFDWRDQCDLHRDHQNDEIIVEVKS